MNPKPAAQDDKDSLAPYRTEPPVRIVREIESIAEIPAGVRVQRVVYESVNVTTPGGRETNEVYALIARPGAPGVYPGLLLLHGGGGCAEEAQALAWAQRGYVVVTPDLPGIANPEKVPHSRGVWPRLPYGGNRWNSVPDIADATTYQAVVAALQAFALLRSQADVDADRIGVTGTSWGGYMTTMICGLLGPKVRAGFSNYGTGFFEDTVFAKELGKLPADVREAWFAQLDAGRRAHGITAPFFIAGAANDTFFFPPAVEKTLAAARGPVGRLHAPNAHHMLPVPGGTPDCGSPAAMAADWFAWHLQGQGAPFPDIDMEAPSSSDLTNEARSPIAVGFQVNSARPITDATVWHSMPPSEGGWPKREWMSVPARQDADGTYRALLPAGCRTDGAAWFALVSDGLAVSVSSALVSPRA